MTDERNANALREYYLTHKGREKIENICTATQNWNGCDYCDLFAGKGLPCWKQDGKHNCIRCTETKRKETIT